MPGALRLLDLLSGPEAVIELAGRLLADAWVVERLEDLPKDFAGIAATRQGRVWFAAWGEVRQLSEGGSERVLARHNERDRLIAQAELAAQAEHAARVRSEQALEQVRAADETRVGADDRAACGRAPAGRGRRGAAADAVADRAAPRGARAGRARRQDGRARG